MSVFQKLDQRLFPIDLKSINTVGLYLDRREFTQFRMLMVMLVAPLFAYLIFYGSDPANFTYLTYWGFTLCTIYFLVAMVLNLVETKLDPKVNLWKIVHSLFCLIMTTELMINMIFWVVLFPQNVRKYYQITALDVIQALCAHFIPLLLMIVETMANCVAIWNYSPLLYIVLVLLLYLIMNMTYSLVVEPVYQVMTFRDGISYVFVLGSLLLVLISFYLLKLYFQYFKRARIQQLLAVNQQIKKQTPTVDMVQNTQIN